VRQCLLLPFSFSAYEAAKANLQQLQQIQGFQQVVAPFTGKITARNIDVGTLVTAGTGNSGTPLFNMVESDPLRVYVYVPQTNAASVHEKLMAKILVQELPGRDFDGTWRGYPAWIRTMNNASKGRCVTVTPRGNPILDCRAPILGFGARRSHS
jgi:multidrug resistance efflux pump